MPEKNRLQRRNSAYERLDSAYERLRRGANKLLEWFGWKRGPDDPFAYVGAPKKPRPPQRSAGASAPLD